ncbi:MAG: amidohydrolase family protein [Alphaproteobacteria bacterium]|nr:amidohydrolase family protein [Alphaproteobacteria bacterium]MBU1526690.1 amidohydrolase family protein [Alphaproteobacteria bacterium]MBU2117632.1 amidohydrolase family protein [Alphaproteobacteria bacterium]MBU2350198.1 amidohydrolase family protein [Alphaproteobacteria bacterium]MBU2383537.1 amidohydrolase family protein [Alphaproteobacteria bacterium]
MIRRTLLLAAAVMAVAGPALAQEVTAIVGGRVHTGTSVIENGTVVMRDSRIVSVGTGGAPAGARVVDASGKVVTPGIVAVDSGLGGSEISSVGDDLRNSSNTLSAAFDVSYGLDPWSITLPTARLGGVTRAVVVPNHPGSSGGHYHEEDTAGAGEGGYHTPGLFAGQAAVIHLGQGTDILVRPRVAMVAPFGDAGAGVAGGARGAEFTLFRETMAEVRLYARNKSAYERGGLRDLSLSRADLEALIPVAEGRMPLIVTVSRASDILMVLRLADEENIKVILDGAEEGWMVADQIAAAGVPVLVNPVTNLPGNLERRGARMQNAAVLHAAGVVIAIKGNEGSIHRARETRYNAGNAVSHGLPHAAAIAAITTNPARIFGFGDRFGTLAAGAEADVVIWSGDPLEPLSQTVAVFVKGVEQPMTARNLLLRDRYRDGGEGAYPPAYGR